MPQSRHRKRWIKLWTQESLYGSISKELQPDERWCWIGVLLLAGDSPEAGKLLIAPGIPWEDSQIAKALSVPMEVWTRAKQKMLDAGKIVLNSDTIIVCNWDKYQNTRDDYMRQYMRQYRGKKEESTKEENNKEEEEEEEAVKLTSKSNNKHINNKTNSKSFSIWEEASGRMITKYESDQLGSLVDEYGDSSVCQAIQEAANNGRDKVKINYVSKVLESWREGNARRQPRSEEPHEWA